MQSNTTPVESLEKTTTTTPFSRRDYKPICSSISEDKYIELDGVPACYRVLGLRDVSEKYYYMALETAEPLETLHQAFWPASSLPGLIPPKFLYGFPIYMSQIKTFCVQYLAGTVTSEEIWTDDPGFDSYWRIKAGEYLTKEVGRRVVVTISLNSLDTPYVASMADTHTLKDEGSKRPTEEQCDKLAQLLYGDGSGEAKARWHLDGEFPEWQPTGVQSKYWPSAHLVR